MIGLVQMLLQMVADNSMMDVQGRMRSVEWVAKEELVRRRTINLIIEMMVHAMNLWYFAAEAVLSIKLYSQLMGEHLLSTMSLTYTAAGIRDLFAQVASVHK
jgi:hypothetical protein